MKLLKVAIIIMIIIAMVAGGIFIAVYNTASKLIDESIAELAADDDLLKELGSTQASVDQTNTTTEPSITQAEPEGVSVQVIDTPAQVVDITPQTTDTPKTEENPTIPANPEQEESVKTTTSSNPIETKKEIPMKEKLEVTKIVVSKLSTPELNELKDMAAGGVSGEEKKKAKELIYSKFTKEEVEYFKEIYNKYIK